jgi:LPS-assembly lipoprotein
MSWSEPSRRRLLGLFAAPAALAACGFTPLYGTGASAARMAGRVEVAPLPGGPGFSLYERVTGRLGPATAPTHRLEIALELERTGVALTQENVTTRFDIVGAADYRLVPLAGGPPVASGTVRAITGYSAPANPAGSAFAVRAAEQDAERRVAVDLADQIVERLAVGAADWA